MRIAFDVDGVFTDIEKYQLTRGKKYFKNIPEENLKSDEYDVEEIFNVSHKERNKFWTKYIFDYCIKEPMRKDASITLNKLHEEGHEIYIVTGRVHTLEKGFVGALFRKMLIDWLTPKCSVRQGGRPILKWCGSPWICSAKSVSGAYISQSATPGLCVPS